LIDALKTAPLTRPLWRLRWAAGTALIVALFLAGGSDSGGISSPGFTIGRENTWFRVQNQSGTSATIGAAYLNEAGGLIDQDTYPNVKRARSAPPFYQSTNPDLPRGYRGSSTIFSNQRVAGLLFRSIKDGSGLHRYGGVTATLPAPAKRVYLPLVYRNFGYHSAWNTRIIVMNTSANRAACVGLSYWKAGGASTPLPMDPANYPNSCINIPPLGTIRRDVVDMTALGDQWLGSVMVDVAGGDDSASKQIIVANAEIWNKERGNFSSYTGLCWKIGLASPLCPSGAGAYTPVLLPLIFRSYGYLNQWETYLMIQTHDNKTLPVQIDFKGTVNGVPFETTYGPFIVTTSRPCYLASADPAASCSDEGTSNGPLPVGFIGSASVSDAPGEALAVVATRYSNRAPIQSTYSGFSARNVNGTLPPHSTYLPLIYRKYGWRGPKGNARGWNSWFQVQVADGTTAQISVTYFPDNGGPAINEQATINGSGALFQYSNAALGNGFIGSAIIQSDKPVAIVAMVGNDAYVGDADAAYEAVP